MQLLRRKVARFIGERRLFMPGDTVIIALSGGADSMALLDILVNLPQLRLKLVPAHLNHLLRGEESGGDELFVRQTAERYGLTAEVSRVDVAGAAAAARLSLEEAGREARYDFFRKLARKYGAASVALAHHRDDQAETVLLRLLRGSAGSGLAAMRPKGGDGLFVRPLLDVSRGEIEAYLLKAGIPWREDGSNSDIRFLRNRIRHELLPLLRGYNPRIAESLGQTAAALACDEELLCAVTAGAFGRCVTSAGDARIVDLGLLGSEHRALRPRLYRLAIAEVKGDLRRISFSHIAAVEKLVAAEPPNATLDLPGGVLVVREYGRLLFSPVGSRPVPPEDHFSLRIDGAGGYRLPDGRSLVVEEFPSLPEGWRSQGRNTLWVSASAVPLPWEVRYFCAGDRFHPLGMTGEKKLKDLFIDRKIPREERGRIPLVLSGGRIFWVGGVQPAAVVGGVAEGTGVMRLRLAGNPE